MKLFPERLNLSQAEGSGGGGEYLVLGKQQQAVEIEMGPLLKRKRTLRESSIMKLLLLLVMFEEKQRQEQEEWDRIYKLEREMFEENHKRRMEVMMEYYKHLQEYYSELDEIERCRVKRARFSAAAVGAAVATQQSVQRRLWVKNRSQAWWEQCSDPGFPESEFYRSFRMSRSTFDHICEELSSIVAKEDTMLRAAIPVRQRVAVCIWRLATGEPLRLVSKRFGLGISTCHKLVLEVCAAIRDVLLPKYVQWPSKDQSQTLMKEFERISGIPNVVGAMYTTHIPIIAPKINVAAYFNKRHTERNQKTSYSITLQGVVDNGGCFTDVCIGWPGSMPDDRVLENSILYQRGINGLLDGVWVVGSSGYPLLDWLLVPYVQQHLTWTQHAFNEKISEIQKIAKDAFSRLKGRWRCLQKRTEVKLQDLPAVLGACCVLHNVCEKHNEGFDPDLTFELIDDEMYPETCLQSKSSMQARDNIAHNLLHHAHAGTRFL
uniref:DDE Tnp4 domain-containing protein n=1 Tax=Araucaria cunninghamii TaxID=56994 RepID=A0A0D6QUA4_ARACU